MFLFSKLSLSPTDSDSDSTGNGKKNCAIFMFAAKFLWLYVCYDHRFLILFFLPPLLLLFKCCSLEVDLENYSVSLMNISLQTINTSYATTVNILS